MQMLIKFQSLGVGMIVLPPIAIQSTKPKFIPFFSAFSPLSLSKAAQRNSSETQERKKEGERGENVLWVFGYGSLIWKAGFHYDERLVGFVKGYRRVFYQGSTDHGGTPAFPGRTVTLEPFPEGVCWGVAYKVSGEENENIALTYLEVREKQYDMKAYLDFYTDPDSSDPAVRGVLVYIASPDTRVNKNYLGPASFEEIAKQIVEAEGPAGPNRDYLFQLEEALDQFGCEDFHVKDLANAVRKILSAA